MLWSSLGKLFHDREPENKKACLLSNVRSEGQNGDCWWQPLINCLYKLRCHSSKINRVVFLAHCVHRSEAITNSLGRYFHSWAAIEKYLLTLSRATKLHKHKTNMHRNANSTPRTLAKPAFSSATRFRSVIAHCRR